MTKLPDTPMTRIPASRNTRPDAFMLKPEDVIAPTSIEHLVEEMLDERTRVMQFGYNYLKYTFNLPTGEIWARSYLATISEVALYLPQGMTLEHEDARRVLHYLARRYPKIQMLGPKGYTTIKIAKERPHG